MDRYSDAVSVAMKTTADDWAKNKQTTERCGRNNRKHYANVENCNAL